MQITRLLEQVLHYKLQNDKAAIINIIQNYTASLNGALAEGYLPPDIAAHVMLEVEESMKHRVKWELIKCSKGCAFCCNVNVYISEGEAELIVNHCRQKNITIDKHVLLEQLYLSNDERPLHQYSKCAFLASDNSCSIYEARPLNCRKHLSQTDPDLCNCRKHLDAAVEINFEINTEILVSAYSNLGMKEGTMAAMLLDKL